MWRRREGDWKEDVAGNNICLVECVVSITIYSGLNSSITQSNVGRPFTKLLCWGRIWAIQFLIGEFLANNGG